MAAITKSLEIWADEQHRCETATEKKFKPGEGIIEPDPDDEHF